MTAPEREAQDKMAEILFLADNPTCVWAEYKTPNGHAYNRYMMLAQAALAASHAPAVTVTEGWKLVPIEPTEEMLAAAFSETADDMSGDVDRLFRAGYHAMLAAVPTTPQTGSQE